MTNKDKAKVAKVFNEVRGNLCPPRNHCFACDGFRRVVRIVFGGTLPSILKAGAKGGR